MADSSNIPSWAAPKGQAPAAPAPAPAPIIAPQSAPQASSGGGFMGMVKGAVSGVEGAVGAVGSALGGLFKSKPPAPAPAPAIPSWAQPVTAASKKTAAATPPPAAPAGAPSWAQPKQTASPSDSSAPAQKKSSPFGSLFKQPPVSDSTDSSTEESAGPDMGINVGENGQTDDVTESAFLKYLSEGFWGTNDKGQVTGPSAPATVLKTVVQAFPRSAAEIGVSIGQAVAAHTSLKNTMPGSVAVPGNMKWVVGDSPIEGMSFQVSDLEQNIKNSPFAKALGMDKYALPLAFAGVVGGEALNVAPIGGEGGDAAAIEALAKATTEEEAAGVLTKLGFDAHLSLDLGGKFAGMTDKKEIADALEQAKTLQAALSASKSGALDEAGKMAEAGADEAPAAAKSGFNEEDGSYVDMSGDEEEPGNLPEESDGSEEAPSAKIDPLTNAPRAPFVPATDAEKSAAIALATSGKRTPSVAAPTDIHPPASPMPAELKPLAAEARKYSSAQDFKQALLDADQGSRVTSIGRMRTDADKQLSKINAQAQAAFKSGKVPAYDSVEDFYNAATGKESPSTTKSAGQIYREQMAVRLGKNETARPDIFTTPAIPEAAVEDGDQAHALYQTEQGEIKSGPFKGWTKQASDLFQYGFANKRRTGTIQLAGAVMRKKFEGLREAGVDAILRFEGFEKTADGQIVKLAGGPDRTGLYGDAFKANEDMFAADKAAGVQARGKPIAYRQNYLRIYLKGPDGSIYDGNGDLVAAVGGRKVAKSAAFSIPRTFDTNAEALQAGYELAFPNMPDLMAARAMEDQKALGDANIFNGGIKNGLVIPAPALSDDADIRAGFKMLDPERFPKYSTRYRDRNTGMMKEYVGPYYAPEKFADKVNAFLADPATSDSFSRGWARAAKVTGTIKNAALSIGIPNFSKLGLGKLLGTVIGKEAGERVAQIGSGISLHFWNLLPRAALGEKSPIQFFRYGLDPMAAQKYVYGNLDQALHYAEQGLTLSAEEHDASALDLKDLSTISGIGRNANAASQWLHGLFGEGIFGKVMPAMKLRGAIARTEQFVAKGYSQAEAERMAANWENTIWGGTNLDELGANKNTQNFLRTLFIAPDYARTNIKLGVNMAKALTVGWNDKALTPYRNFAAALITGYVTLNFLQKETEGTFMIENDPIHTFSLKMGTDSNGKTRYFNPFGTGADALRLPVELAAALKEDNLSEALSILTNRLSIPVDSAMELLKNNDWAGQRIYGSDIYGNPISPAQEAGNIFSTTVGSVLPGASDTLIGALTGKFSPEQAMLQGLALPFGYKNETPDTATIKKIEADAKTGIANGDYTLFDQLVKAKVISSRSRAAFIKDALTGTKTAAQLRTSAKDKARLSAEEKELQQEGFSR